MPGPQSTPSRERWCGGRANHIDDFFDVGNIPTEALVFSSGQCAQQFFPDCKSGGHPFY
jgi:hypothetical protein